MHIVSTLALGIRVTRHAQPQLQRLAIMALIDCPQCGHKVLSVASTCPKCGFSLSEQRKKDAHFSKNVECRTCRREIAPGSRICPHCGEVNPVRRFQMWPIAGVLVLAMLIATPLIFWYGREDATQPPVSLPAAQTSPVQQDTLPSDSAVADSTPVTPPIVAAPPVEPTQTRSTMTRWTNNWANVRAGRGTTDTIVSVLVPGQMVEVADPQDGWWAVYVDGQPVGFVAQSLIVEQPPQLEPDTASQEPDTVPPRSPLVLSGTANLDRIRN
jgi:predicted RNA-binding Zn-ribbon protein involved in translation (DUF1610 family)